ncbi:MAG: hypothetical protein MUC92_10410 [Fimbriimonadaceae bacterium]|jgi:hypothetical protein|nr:hypothetical protein [Fimbriimonadaceae bacterium]
MKVQNIECQLIQVQLKRYLKGDDLPQELISDIERHIATCPECLAIAKGEKPLPAAAPKISSPSILTRLMARITSAKGQETPTPQNWKDACANLLSNRKLLLQSVGLVVVLAVMMFLLRDPTRLFGPKGNVALAATEATQEEEQEPSAAEEALAASKKSSGDKDLSELPHHEMTESAPSETTTAGLSAMQEEIPASLAKSEPASGPEPLVQTPATLSQSSGGSSKLDPTNQSNSPGKPPQPVATKSPPLTEDVSAVVPNFGGQKVVVSEKSGTTKVPATPKAILGEPMNTATMKTTSHRRVSSPASSSNRRQRPSPRRTRASSKPAAKPQQAQPKEDPPQNAASVRVYDSAGKPVK